MGNCIRELKNDTQKTEAIKQSSNKNSGKIKRSSSTSIEDRMNGKEYFHQKDFCIMNRKSS